MQWILMDESSKGSGYEPVNFTMRCVDKSDSERRVVSLVKVRSYLKVTIELPVKIIAKEQLDESIIISLAIMDR